MSRRNPRIVPGERTLEALEALRDEFDMRIHLRLCDGPKGGWSEYVANKGVDESTLTVSRVRRHRWCCSVATPYKRLRNGVLRMKGARYFASTARAAYLKALWSKP